MATGACGWVARGGGGVLVAALVQIDEDFLGGADVLLPWRAAAAPGLAWIRSDPAASMAAACFDPVGLLHWRTGSSFPLLPAVSVGAAGLVRIKAAVLGFLSRQEKDLPVACLY